MPLGNEPLLRLRPALLGDVAADRCSGRRNVFALDFGEPQYVAACPRDSAGRPGGTLRICQPRKLKRTFLLGSSTFMSARLR